MKSSLHACGRVHTGRAGRGRDPLTAIGIVRAVAKLVSPPIKHIFQGSSQIYLGTPAGRMLELGNVACNYRLITPAHQSFILLDSERYSYTSANGLNELVYRIGLGSADIVHFAVSATLRRKTQCPNHITYIDDCATVRQV